MWGVAPILALALALLLTLQALLLPDPPGGIGAAGRHAARRHREGPGEGGEKPLSVPGAAVRASSELIGPGPLFELRTAGMAAEVIERHQDAAAAFTASSSLA